MTIPPRHQSQNRNAPCSCGSGKRFKHCHGEPQTAAPPIELQRVAQEALRRHEAKERLRQSQQGYGKPIISVEHKGFRMVAVANRIMYSRSWRFFTDFLLHFLKETLGRAWMEKARTEGVDHPIFEWLDHLQEEHRKTDGKPAREGVVATGYIRAILELSYSLYLIAHHDKISDGLIRRLRRPADFRSAMYEAKAAAAFALAGATIKDAEVGRGADTSPEFWAAMKSGKRYSVEAKRKIGWSSKIELSSSDFRGELERWVRDQLYKSSKKKLHNGIYWFELSIPGLLSENNWREVASLVRDVIENAEGMTVGREPVRPAYVVVTNTSHLVENNGDISSEFAVLDAFRMDDFLRPGLASVDDIIDNADAHRDIHWVFDCLSEVQKVPMAFDGAPPELFDKGGVPIQPCQIGDKLALDMPDGSKISGRLVDIVASGEVATVVLEDLETKAQRIVTMPLKPEEERAAAIYGSIIFGKPEYNRGRKVDGPAQLYEWLINTFSTYDRSGLLKQIEARPDKEDFSNLETEALRKRVARELTKALYAKRNGAPPV